MSRHIAAICVYLAIRRRTAAARTRSKTKHPSISTGAKRVLDLNCMIPYIKGITHFGPKIGLAPVSMRVQTVHYATIKLMNSTS